MKILNWFNRGGKPIKKRSFEAARYQNTLTRWARFTSSTFNEEIKQDLVSLRTRSRDASVNDPYGRRFFAAIKNNVIGSEGISVRLRVLNDNLTPDNVANNVLERHFKNWSKKATVDGRSFRQAQRLFVETMARDGECIVQHCKGNRYGPYGYQLRFLEAEHLDVEYNFTLNNGNQIINSIEYDEEGRVVAYHLWKYNPNNTQHKHNERIRIPAKEIIHGYDKERCSQGRGFPWLSAGLLNMTHIKEYQKTELIAARVASAKMGFFTKSEGAEGNLGDEYDEEAGAFVQEAEPGMFDVLPSGYSLQSFDPQNPNANFPAFVKSILRGVAASVGLSYHTLSNDLESTSYSSLRQGALDERETFKSIQAEVVEQFMVPVFENWLEMALLIQPGDLKLPLARFEKFNRPEFLPRKWAWIDPNKEASALKMMLEQKLKSRTEIIRDLGRDFDNVLAEIAEEQQKMEELGVVPQDTIDQMSVLQGLNIDTEE